MKLLSNNNNNNNSRAGYEAIPTVVDTPRMHRMSSSEDRSRSRVLSWSLLSVLLLTLPAVIQRYQQYHQTGGAAAAAAAAAAAGDQPQHNNEQDNGMLQAAVVVSYNNNNVIGDLRSRDRDSEDASTSQSVSSQQQQQQQLMSSNSKQHESIQVAKERFYHHQKIDHFCDDNYGEHCEQYWSNRYYQTTQYWNGPGYPIFVIIGGEGATDDGFFYPFITEHLAPHFGAAVLQIEHRFYGPHVPVVNATNHQLLHLLTVPQALADMVRLTQHVRTHHLDCSPERTSVHYCPVITVGGSYPGALSAWLRMVYPDFIDAAYAASAPLLMYAQSPRVQPTVYYDIVTRAADAASPGCAAAVRQTLHDMQTAILEAPTLDRALQAVDVCPGEALPQYIVHPTMLAEALVEIASFKFAYVRGFCLV